MNILGISPGLGAMKRIIIYVKNSSAMMQKGLTQCERTNIEGGRYGAHLVLLPKGR